jgi:1-hydroxycarotenoid 3,4-desaturase
VRGSFRDERLRQLFGRYATYCGSSPYLAPATLGMIAQVEADGVWLLTEGLYSLARGLERSARALGVQFRYDSRVLRLELDHGRIAALQLATGERLDARRVVFNGDAAALAAGLLGNAARHAAAALPESRRSLSALTWNLVAQTSGAPLAHHTVCFSADYAREFRELFTARRVPTEPTVYLCAQDRDSEGGRHGGGAERLLCLVNAPATGDRNAYSPDEVAACEARMRRQLERCGLALQARPEGQVVTTPADFHRLYPGTGGALYGAATHGWRAAFTRPRARTRIPGLYLAGGSAHPGAGMPMAALSGLHAAACVIQDLASTHRSPTMATRGGTWMRWATTPNRD